MIEVNDLCKDYEIVRRKHLFFGKTTETVHAVKGISFSIQDGEKVGMIGLNGAGKTTTIKMLTGILTPTAGTVLVNGFRPAERKREFLSQISVSMGQRSGLFYDIALRESLEYSRAVYGVAEAAYQARLREFDECLEIGPLLDTPVRKLSFGQRRKSELACALLHNPGVIFLDEPTIGLDVVAKENVFTFLNLLNQKYHAAILLTTHELENIERFCQRIVVLEHGTVLYDGKISRFSGMEHYRRICMSRALYEKRKFSFPNAVETENGVEFVMDLQEHDCGDLFHGLQLADFTVEKLTLEDMIRKLERTGK